MEALRTRYIIENYDPVKKQTDGPAAHAGPGIDIEQLPRASVKLHASGMP